MVDANCIIRYFVFKNSPQGRLLVILENMNTGKRDELNEIGGFSAKWVRYSNRLSGYPRGFTYRIIFTATLTANSTNFVDPYVALDDISFSKECTITTGPIVVPTLPNHSPMTTPPPNNCPTISCLDSTGKQICLRANQFCDFVTDCKDGTDELNCGNCNFENGLCGWRPMNSRANWVIQKPASSAPVGLPKQDADNNGQGGYLTVRSILFTSPNIRIISM